MNDFIPYISQSLDQILTSLRYFYPELALIILFLIIIITDLFFSKKGLQLTFFIVIGGLLIVSFLTIFQLKDLPSASLFGEMIALTKLSVFFKLIFLVVTILFVLFVRNNKQLQNHKKGLGDLYAIVIAVLLGLNLMAVSSNLLMIYLSIEMVSVGSYLMVGYVSANDKQAEAAIKYALFGATCSAIMLYGMSLLYSFTGTLDIYDSAFIDGLERISSLSSGVALTMVLIGIAFKLSMVPLHFWSPDVYEGAPTPVTAFLSSGPKVAGFAVLISVLSAFRSSNSFVLFDFYSIIGSMALITMVVGNFSAIWQNNIKRMLAYSSIGHTGFILIAVIAFSDSSYQSILFYLFTYSIMNMAAFMLTETIEEQTGAVNVSDYKGFGKHFQLIFFIWIVVLISLTGLPPTAGFIGKLLVFSSALESYNLSNSNLMLGLMITGALTTVVSLFYYLKIPLNAYLRNPDTEIVITSKNNFIVYLCVFLCFILIITGIFPQIVTALYQ